MAGRQISNELVKQVTAYRAYVVDRGPGDKAGLPTTFAGDPMILEAYKGIA
jgi:hypothetical protein